MNATQNLASADAAHQFARAETPRLAAGDGFAQEPLRRCARRVLVQVVGEAVEDERLDDAAAQAVGQAGQVDAITVGAGVRRGRGRGSLMRRNPPPFRQMQVLDHRLGQFGAQRLGRQILQGAVGGVAERLDPDFWRYNGSPPRRTHPLGRDRGAARRPGGESDAVGRAIGRDWRRLQKIDLKLAEVQSETAAEAGPGRRVRIQAGQPPGRGHDVAEQRQQRHRQRQQTFPAQALVHEGDAAAGLGAEVKAQPGQTQTAGVEAVARHQPGKRRPGPFDFGVGAGGQNPELVRLIERQL